MSAAGHKLQELHGKLHIAYCADALLNICLAFSGARGFLLDPAFVLPDILDKPLLDTQAVDERLDHLDKGASNSLVAGDESGFEESLPLPVLRPGFVVGATGRKGARDRAKPSLRPEPQVDPKDNA